MAAALVLQSMDIQSSAYCFMLHANIDRDILTLDSGRNECVCGRRGEKTQAGEIKINQTTRGMLMFDNCSIN